jgi:hypothetical protein
MKFHPHLQKPQVQPMAQAEFYGSETTVHVPPSGGFRRDVGGGAITGPFESFSTGSVDGSQLSFVDSAQLSTMGLFGRLMAMMNDFAGGNLVTTDAFALLGQTEKTQPQEYVDLRVSNVAGVTFHAASLFAHQFPTNGFGDLVTAFVQDDQNVGLFSDEHVQINTHQNGTFDIYTWATLDNAADLARFNDQVESKINDIAATEPGVSYYYSYTNSN